MSPCEYFGPQYSSILIAVGWLEGDNEYNTGNIDKNIYGKLKELLIDPPHMTGLPVTCGLHSCSICQFEGPQSKDHLLIPWGRRIIISPVMVGHYISCHRYSPPLEFIEAVNICPDTRSMDYKKLLLKNNGRILFKT